MNPILLILSIAVPTLFGWEILKLFFLNKNNSSFLERLFWAYGLGFGGLTLCMLYLSFLKITFNIVLILLILAVCLMCLRRYRSKVSFPKRTIGILSNDHEIVAFGIFLFVLFNILILFFRTMVIDVDMWDSWAFWAFKAKIFYIHKIVPLAMFKELRTVWGNWDYPLHVPLMETWILLWQGVWEDFSFRIIFPLFYTGISVIGFYFLRERLSLTGSLVGVLFLSSFPSLQIYTMGTIAEPVLLFYYVSSFVLLHRWMESGNGRFLILSALFAGLTLWTKSEGLVLVAGNIFLMVFFLLSHGKFKREANKICWYLLIILIIIAPWNIYKMTADIQNVAFNTNYLQLERLPIYFKRVCNLPLVFGYHFFNFRLWNILWLMTGIALILNLNSSKDKLPTYILFSILFQCFMYAFGYVTIPWGENVFVYDTMIRLMMAPAILAILYSSFSLFKAKPY